MDAIETFLWGVWKIVPSEEDTIMGGTFGGNRGRKCTARGFRAI